MKIFLTTWFLINGGWVHGSNFDGWSSLRMDSEKACESRQRETDKNPSMVAPDFDTHHGKKYKVRFTCESIKILGNIFSVSNTPRGHKGILKFGQRTFASI